jgi:dephospho-CoA kinase
LGSKPFQKTLIWGLTGGIASGKSSVGLYFAELGVPVIDADQISRTLTEEGGAAHPAILKRFGTTDRAKLRAIVFSENSKDPQARKDLEAILHPLIVLESQKEMDKYVAAGAALIIYEATLLIETGRDKTLDGLIVVVAQREEQRERLISHRAMSGELADQILNAQISNEDREKAATFVITNSGTHEELRTKVHTLLPQLLVAPRANST